MTRSRLPVDTARGTRGRRGRVRGTGGASGSPPAAQPLSVGFSGPLLIDSRQVASLLGIGHTKTFQLIASGELPSIRLGRCVRVPAMALAAWIEARTRKEAEPD